jgi:hypothetical protein
MFIQSNKYWTSYAYPADMKVAEFLITHTSASTNTVNVIPFSRHIIAICAVYFLLITFFGQHFKNLYVVQSSVKAKI